MIGKIRIVFWLGVVLMFLPFFGIPNTWKTVIAILIGISLVLIAVQLRKHYRSLRIIIRNLEQSAAAPSFHE
jgi:NADH:ubiquinone oxidoreductase subunit K